MPQPIRRKCHVALNGLGERLDHAALLGQVVSISGRLESLLGWTLALFSRGSAEITVPMFNAVSSTDAQRSMLLVAAERALAPNEYDAFSDLMEDFRPRYKERNKLVHNLWGHSDDHPEMAVWCKASEAAAIMAQAATFTDPSQLRDIPDFSTKCMLYSLLDLNDVCVRLGEYTLRVTNFLQQLAESHPALASEASASTDAPPIGEEPRLDLDDPDQTGPQSDQPKD